MAESDVYILLLILTAENLKVLSNNFQDPLAQSLEQLPATALHRAISMPRWNWTASAQPEHLRTKGKLQHYVSGSLLLLPRLQR